MTHPSFSDETQASLPLARPARLRLPPAKTEERLAIKMSDFNRIREAVRDMTDPLVHASEWATTFFGAFFAFGIAFLAEPHHEKYRRVIFGLLAIMVLILALFMTWVEKGDRKERKRDKERIDKDMKTVEAEAPRLVTETTPLADDDTTKALSKEAGERHW